MHLSDMIQLLILTTMTMSVLFMAVQTRLQNRLLRAQLLRDRLDLYWKTYEPIADEQLQQFNDYPEDYFVNRQEYEERYAASILTMKHMLISICRRTRKTNNAERIMHAARAHGVADLDGETQLLRCD